MNIHRKNEIACVCGWLVTALAVVVYALFCSAKRMPLWALAALALASCRVDYSALAAHKEACVKSGNVLVEMGKADGEPCWMTEHRLGQLVRTDPDCRAYWGDAGVELCSTKGGLDGGN